MMTPNWIKEERRSIERDLKNALSPLIAEALKKKRLAKLHELVLLEIAKGSIDPKSLALAATMPPEKL